MRNRYTLRTHTHTRAHMRSVTHAKYAKDSASNTLLTQSVIIDLIVVVIVIVSEQQYL